MRFLFARADELQRQHADMGAPAGVAQFGRGLGGPLVFAFRGRAPRGIAGGIRRVGEVGGRFTSDLGRLFGDRLR